MNRNKNRQRQRAIQRRRRDSERRQNKSLFRTLVSWLIPAGELFPKTQLHGNVKWSPEQLAMQAVLWAWQKKSSSPTPSQ
jgi:hypothetical protein